MKTLYFASANRGKTREVQNLFSGLAEVRDLNDLGIPVTWEETGATFCENALIKARALRARVSGGAVFADDSGLCVDALDGAPGVMSARWAGSNADDEANNRKLLDALKHTPQGKRTAAFVCCLAYIDDEGRDFVFEARLEGQILFEARGNLGFGYDPLFVPKGLSESLGELDLDQKNRISHRFQAVKKLKEHLL